MNVRLCTRLISSLDIEGIEGINRPPIRVVCRPALGKRTKADVGGRMAGFREVRIVYIPN
jgi:hypothetical protein